MAAPRELDLTITLAQAWDSWGRHLQACVEADTMSPDTIRGYLPYARRAVDFLGPDRTCDSVEAEEITRWMAVYRAERNGGPATLRFCHKSIKGLMQHAEDRRWLRENPMRDVTTPPVPVHRSGPERAALSREELDSMFAAARAGHGSFKGSRGEWARDEIVLRLAGESGLRAMEITSLGLGDIRRTPEGDWAAEIRRGKGRKPRTTPITDTCAALIRDYVEQWRPASGDRPDHIHRAHGRPVGADKNALLLTFQGHRIDPSAVRHIVARCAKAALGRHYVPHGLRHTAGTLLAREAKADVAVVAHVLGHSDISVTSVYLDTRGDEAAAYVNRRKPGRRSAAVSRKALPPGQDTPTWPEECGTRKGWQRHRREKVPRCGPCRYWYRGAQEELAVLRRLMPERLHGTLSGFRDWKCRCDRCHAARALSDSPDCRLVLPPRQAMAKVLCPGCGEQRSLTVAGVMRRHRHGEDACPGSGQQPAVAPLHLAADPELWRDAENDEAA